ncbi:MAG TPA: LysR family transcriptional regulator [Pseudomonadales bacterium]|nr:LysR family transcriptional regulator [Pseudomonadales bacterium]
MPSASQLDWNLVRTFIAVAEQGSLAGAARQLGLAHPTVARHVQQLEESLALKLFERTTAGLAINEAGLRLAEVGRRMNKDAMAFEAVSETVRTTTNGTVRITIAEVMMDLVPGLLAPLHDPSGDADRRFEIIVSQDQLNLLEREADIAIRHVRPEQSELVCRRVGALPMAAYASETYVKRHGMPQIGGLDTHWFIDGASRQGFAMAVERLGQRVPQERVAFRSDSLHSQRRAALAHWGVVALPTYLGEATPGLCRVMTDTDEDVSLEIWVVARPGARQQVLLKQVSELLADGLSKRFGTHIGGRPDAGAGTGLGAEVGTATAA